MDSHPFPLLEGSQAVRRSRLSAGIHRASPESTAHRCSCGTAVEKRRWLQQNRVGKGLTERLRCLSSAQVSPGWTTSTSPCNDFSANGDYPLNFVSRPRGSLHTINRGTMTGPAPGSEANKA